MDIHQETVIDWQVRGNNCEVCAKKNLVNPINVYCRTCDKYFCHCCLICHQEFTNGHAITQRVVTPCGTGTNEQQQQQQQHTQGKEKKLSLRKKLSSCGSEKNKQLPANATVCCGDQSIAAERNKEQNLPTPIFEKWQEWSLREVTTDTYITGITTTDEGNLFMCDVGNLKVFGYNLKGSLFCECAIPFPPSDICSISGIKLASVSLLEPVIYLLEWDPKGEALTLTDTVRTSDKLYASICKSSESVLLACDCFTNVDILNFNGELLSSVFTGQHLSLISTFVHRICPGQTESSFWMLDYNSQLISDCTVKGLRVSSHRLGDKIKSRTDDILMDKSGLLYGCTVDEVYYYVPNEERLNCLISFESRLATDARMCWDSTQNYLIICLETSDDYMIKIFQKK